MHELKIGGNLARGGSGARDLGADGREEGFKDRAETKKFRGWRDSAEDLEELLAGASVAVGTQLGSEMEWTSDIVSFFGLNFRIG